MTGHLGPSFSMIIPIHFLTAWASDAFSSLFVFSTLLTRYALVASVFFSSISNSGSYEFIRCFIG